MTLHLDPRCKQRLVDITAEALRSVYVRSRIIVGRESFGDLEPAERALHKAGKPRPELVQYIGERPFETFVQEELSKEFIKGEYVHAPAQSLSEIPGYENLRAVSERLVNSFDELPRQCIFSLRLPIVFDGILPDEVTHVGRSFRFDRAARAGLTKVQLAGPNKLASLLSVSNEVAPQIRVLQLETPGYLGEFVSTATEHDALSSFKSFLGLLCALGIVHVAMYEPSDRESPAVMTMHAVEKTTEQNIADKSIDVPGTFSETLVKLRATHTDQQKLLVQLARVGRAFDHSDACRKILLAAEWLYSGSDLANELLSFVQTVVVLEILLGDKAKTDILGLSELLRNRCAYLIGRTAGEREDIIQRFNEIYQVRSSIVHSGKARLNDRERQLMYTLRGYCSRVIRAELELFERDLASQEDRATPVRVIS